MAGLSIRWGCGGTQVLADNASGRFTFDTPDSRAVLFHFRRYDSN